MGKQQKGSGGYLPAPGWLVGLFVAAAALTVLFVLPAWTAFRAGTEKTATLDRLSYDETASFAYTAKTEPSSLYPTGVVGPVTVDSKDAPKAIYSPTVPAIDLSFHYALKDATLPAAGFTGEVSAAIKVSSGKNGWSKTVDLLAPTTFSGTSTDVQLPVDLTKVEALIKTIEGETKSTSNSYTVAVIPTVHVTGQLGPNKVDDTYAPAFTMTLGQNQTVLDQALSRSETRKQQEKVTLPQHMNVLFFQNVTVANARWVSGGLLAGSLAMTLALASVIFLGVGRGEAARIRARYGSMVISVTDAQLPTDPSQQIRLASIQDLVRLANKDSRMVFHQVRPDGSDAYFVQDGALTCLYVSPAGRTPAATKAQEA